MPLYFDRSSMYLNNINIYIDFCIQKIIISMTTQSLKRYNHHNRNITMNQVYADFN